MGFWAKPNNESDSDGIKLSPLTDDVLAESEAKFGVKLPPALVGLLRTQNGGYLENRDFKFRDEPFSVREILGIRRPQEFNSLGPLLCLDNEDNTEMRENLEAQAGDLSKLIQFAGNDYVSYLLDYNRLNAAGEPTVIAVVLDDPEEVEVERIADSFTEFMRGQYAGDAEPAVRLEEADQYKLVAEGGYEGKHTVTGATIRITWKICSHRSRLIVYKREEGWEGGEMRERSELHKSALCMEFPALEDYGVELDPDLAANIRSAVEIEMLGEFDVPVEPRCYQFLLHVQPGGSKLVSRQISKAEQGRWKNDSYRVWHTDVYSADKAALERTMAAVAKSCSGLRRFFG